MHTEYDKQREHVAEELRSVGVIRRYRLLMLGASDEKAAGRFLPFLPVFIMLPIVAGAWVENHLGNWTFAVVLVALCFDVWLFM